MNWFNRKKDGNAKGDARMGGAAGMAGGTAGGGSFQQAEDPRGADAALSGSPSTDSRACYRQLTAALSGSSQGVILKLHIENFKRMNELFGVGYCEGLLEAILGFLQDQAKSPVFRYVGVEFIAILQDHTQGQASRLAEALIDRFQESWTISGRECTCSCQIGLCSYPGFASTADELLKYLDLAVGQAEAIGSNEYAVYDSQLHSQFLRRQSIARGLGAALDKDEVEVRFRPTYHTQERQFTRAELSMRIFIPDLGMVGSAEYVPVAEDTGQIRRLEYYTLNRAALLIARLLEEQTPFESIAVPVSAVVLLQEDFTDTVDQLLEYYHIPSGKLAIEVDEAALSTSFVPLTVVMQELSALGVELILNNFGSGYSGLNRLLELPADTLKFERMFIWQLEANPQSEPIVEGMIQIASRLGRRLIAEGVETERQQAALKRFGCPYQQGFYYAPAVSEDALSAVLGKSLKAAQAVLDQEREKGR